MNEFERLGRKISARDALEAAIQHVRHAMDYNSAHFDQKMVNEAIEKTKYALDALAPLEGVQPPLGKAAKCSVPKE